MRHACIVIEINLLSEREIHIPVNLPVFAKNIILANFDINFLKVLTLVGDF